MSSSSAKVARFVLSAAGRPLTVRLLLTIFASSLLDLAGIVVIFPYLRVVMDDGALAKLTALGSEFLPQWPRRELLLGISFLLIVIYLAKSAAQIFLMRYQSRRVAQLTTQLSDRAAHHLLHARYGFYLQTPVSEIGGIAFSSPVHVALVFRAMLQMINELVFMGALLIVFLLVNPFITLAVVALLSVVAVALYFSVIRNTASLGRQQAEAENARYRLLYSMINAIRDIKVMDIASVFESINKQATASYEKIAWRYNFNYSVPLVAIEAAVLVGVVGAVMGIIMLNVDIAQALPVIGVIAVASVRFVPAIAKFFTSFNSFRFYSASTLRFQSAQDELIEAIHERKSDDLTFKKEISIDQVGFHYGDKTILEGISLSIKPGKSYGIVGPSGSGKSTLLDVLTGLQPAGSGGFSCDGRPFDPFSSASLAQLVGYVPQNITLIDDSVAFNITFTRHYDVDRLQNAIRMANLQSVLIGLPDGVATFVGENGARLSGGQRQRIGLARALYRNPAILVLDEATSALDPITEREIIQELAELKGQMALLMVSHRIAAVQDCDEIIVLSRGRIVDRGQHDVLIGSSKLYQDLYQSQNSSI